MKKQTGIMVEKDYLQEIKDTLERCLIILEDNPKIKDVAEFYTSEDLVGEIAFILKDLEIK
jgi:primosomal protein N''